MPESTCIEAEAFEGMSLADVATHGTGAGASVLAEMLECACSGVMACSTCHVVIDPEWFARVGKPDEDELDMLDLAFEPTDTSRLGCQVTLRPELDGLRVRIPRGAHNMMDDIPFPDR
ncbi:2Fe-2S ferredoxin-type domain-containing protein [Pavlovales sp. CCMP2436]|nr:2Fe-2S ferredoxin-type domain-containing protein [Pavlovales sp. CCMP2436]